MCEFHLVNGFFSKNGGGTTRRNTQRTAALADSAARLCVLCLHGILVNLYSSYTGLLNTFPVPIPQAVPVTTCVNFTRERFFFKNTAAGQRDATHNARRPLQTALPACVCCACTGFW